MSAISQIADVHEEHNLFPISAVVEATGVPAVTLRAWERRYDFLQPHRTPKGHRLFSVEQIELVRRVTSLIDSGVPVGRIGDLIRQEALLRDVEAAAGGDGWETFQDDMHAAVRAFDERQLDLVYESALSRFSESTVTERLIIPMLQRLGASWQQGETGVAEEHFFSLYIRNKLGARWHHGQRPLAGRKIVVACLPGDRHEYGLLFFALVARSRGFDPVLLGADMPLQQLAGVARRCRATAIVISCTLKPDFAELGSAFDRLVSESPVPVFAGGAGVLAVTAELEALGVTPVGAELLKGVETIFSALNGRARNAGESA